MSTQLSLEELRDLLYASHGSNTFISGAPITAIPIVPNAAPSSGSPSIIPRSTIDEARSLVELGNVADAWKLLGAAGDKYALRVCPV